MWHKSYITSSSSTLSSISYQSDEDEENLSSSSSSKFRDANCYYNNGSSKERVRRRSNELRSSLHSLSKSLLGKITRRRRISPLKIVVRQ
jgi:hypothetical protein